MYVCRNLVCNAGIYPSDVYGFKDFLFGGAYIVVDPNIARLKSFIQKFVNCMCVDLKQDVVEFYTKKSVGDRLIHHFYPGYTFAQHQRSFKRT